MITGPLILFLLSIQGDARMGGRWKGSENEYARRNHQHKPVAQEWDSNRDVLLAKPRAMPDDIPVFCDPEGVERHLFEIVDE